MAVLETLRYQLYERRLDNCLFARDRCKEGSWGWIFWQDRFAILMRKMNQELTGVKCYGSTDGSNPSSQGSTPCAPAKDVDNDSKTWYN